MKNLILGAMIVGAFSGTAVAKTTPIKKTNVYRVDCGMVARNAKMAYYAQGGEFEGGLSVACTAYDACIASITKP